MSLLKKLFGIASKDDGRNLQSTERGKFMPDSKLPLDERFTINFKANGGKFLYCENLDEIYQSFNNIMAENQWQNQSMYTIDKSLKRLFKDITLDFNVAACTNDSQECFFTTCENLIADDGSLLISSNQIAETKLSTLPKNFIVFATTSQIIENISDGLRGIKYKNTQKIPTNITTIKNFKTAEEKHFLSYGSSSKNLYLLLLEDL